MPLHTCAPPPLKPAIDLPTELIREVGKAAVIQGYFGTLSSLSMTSKLMADEVGPWLHKEKQQWRSPLKWGKDIKKASAAQKKLVRRVGSFARHIDEAEINASLINYVPILKGGYFSDSEGFINLKSITLTAFIAVEDISTLPVKIHSRVKDIHLIMQEDDWLDWMSRFHNFLRSIGICFPNLAVLKVEWMIGNAVEPGELSGRVPPTWLLQAQHHMSAVMAIKADYDIEVISNLRPKVPEVDDKQPKMAHADYKEGSITLEFELGQGKRSWIIRYCTLRETQQMTWLFVSSICTKGPNRLEWTTLRTIKTQLWVPGRHIQDDRVSVDTIDVLVQAILYGAAPKRLYSHSLSCLNMARQLVEHDSDQASGIIPVCPQVNIIWELFAKRHTSSKKYYLVRRLRSKVAPAQPLLNAQEVLTPGPRGAGDLEKDWVFEDIKQETSHSWKSGTQSGLGQAKRVPKELKIIDGKAESLPESTQLASVMETLLDDLWV